MSLASPSMPIGHLPLASAPGTGGPLTLAGSSGGHTFPSPFKAAVLNSHVHPFGSASGSSSRTSHEVITGHNPEPDFMSDPLDLKERLAEALGENGMTYWTALVAFMTGRTSRDEFEEQARSCLERPGDVHLHNRFIMAILFNASVPLSPSSGAGPSKRRQMDGRLKSGSALDVEDRRRLKLKAAIAGLGKKERKRLKLAGTWLDDLQTASGKKNSTSKGKKAVALAKAAALATNGGDAASKDRDGEDADKQAEKDGETLAVEDQEEVLRKRAREEKEERERKRRKQEEAITAIGAPSRSDGVLGINDVKGKVPAVSPQELTRLLSAPLCVDSKQLPALDTLRDRMTLICYENGLTGGVASKTVEMMSLALEMHIQHLSSSTIAKVRANRATGVKTSSGPTLHPASSSGLPSSSRSIDGPFSTVSNSSVDVNGGTIGLFGIGNGPFHTSPTQTQLSLSSSQPSTQLSSSSPPKGKTRATDSDAVMTDLTRPTTASYSPGATLGSLSSTHNAKAGGLGFMPRSGSGSGKNEPEPMTTLTLPDFEFMLGLAPHSLVEPLGLGPQERLLSAFEERAEVGVDEGGDGEEGEVEDVKGLRRWLAERERLPSLEELFLSDPSLRTAGVAKEGPAQNGVVSPALSSSANPLASRTPTTATTMAAGTTGADGDAPTAAAPASANLADVPMTSPRNRFIVDMTFPLRVLDRRIFAEEMARRAAEREEEKRKEREEKEMRGRRWASPRRMDGGRGMDLGFGRGLGMGRERRMTLLGEQRKDALHRFHQHPQQQQQQDRSPSSSLQESMRGQSGSGKKNVEPLRTESQSQSMEEDKHEGSASEAQQQQDGRRSSGSTSAPASTGASAGHPPGSEGAGGGKRDRDGYHHHHHHEHPSGHRHPQHGALWDVVDPVKLLSGVLS